MSNKFCFSVILFKSKFDLEHKHDMNHLYRKQFGIDFHDVSESHWDLHFFYSELKTKLFTSKIGYVNKIYTKLFIGWKKQFPIIFQIKIHQISIFFKYIE